MKNLTLRSKKLNDSGMSLVEVLVAMAILAIAGVAFLQSFTYAVQNNKKSRERQNALILAQSMMETCKAYSVEELKVMGSNDVFKLATGSANITKTLDDSAHEYQFHMKNVTLNNYKYDIVVDMEPSSYTNSTGNVGEVTNRDGNDFIIVDNIEAVQEAIMQDAWNRLIAEANTLTNGFDVYLNESYGGPDFLDKNLINVQSREIVVTVGVDPTNTYSVSYQTNIDYSIDSFEYIDKDGNTVPFSEILGCRTTIPGNITFSGDELDSVWLYYYPMYISTGAQDSFTSEWLMTDKDNIKFDYGGSLPLDVYVIKQKVPTVSSLISIIRGYEPHYKLFFTLAGGGQINLYHNLSKPLYDDSGTIQYSAKSVPDGYGSIVDVNGLYDKLDNEVLIYNVDVTIKSEADGTEVIKMSGTTNAR